MDHKKTQNKGRNQEVENKYKYLFENLQESVVIYKVVRNEDGEIIDWILDDCNKLAQKKLGRSYEEAVGKTVTELFGKEQMKDYIERSKRIDKTREVESFDTYFEFNKSYYTSKVFFITKDLYVTASNDTTELKHIEKDREELLAQLFQAQRMESVGRLAGGVAHDFNNMLSIILGNADLALSAIEKSHPHFEFLDQIINGAKRAASITQQLLAFARKQAIAPKKTNLNEAVEHMFKMLRRLIREEIELKWLPSENTPPILIDPTQLDQLIANLCVNAKDAIEDMGQIIIETGEKTFSKGYCERHVGFSEGRFAMLAISDNGSGIPKEIQESIFEPFFTTKETHKGTGLGLSTVYGIVKQHEGFINLYSEPNIGTTFRIYFPVYEAEDQEVTEVSIHKETEGNEIILLVEDDPSILKINTLILKKLGYTVHPISHPFKALDFVKSKQKVDLLLTDVIMPDMNGKELFTQIAQLNPSIKCLFSSGYTDDVIADHGVLDKGVHFLSKPFTIQELARKIRSILDEDTVKM